MNDYLIYSVGLVAQVLFSVRLLVQWLSSEKEKKVVVPILFWILSLFASFLFFIYGFLRNDFAIMIGQLITYYIYIRNIQLQNQWNKIKKEIRIFLLAFPLIAISISIYNGVFDFEKLVNNQFISSWLLFLGVFSQLLFTFRFVYQWMVSERKKVSTLPVGFWVISILGASLILIYAILRKDPVLFIGQVFGLIIYIRNLFILKKT